MNNIANLVEKNQLKKMFNAKRCALMISTLILGVITTQSSALAVSFKVTEVKTDEGFIFDGSNNTAVTPTGLNSVTSFTIDGTTEIFTDDFFAIKTEGVTTSFPIQPRTLNGETLTTKLFESDDDFLSAGVNGLSLSTGVNKITNQAVETLIFPVISLNVDAINDNQVDFFVADIAQNQSPDAWKLLDENGGIVASLTTNGNKSSDGANTNGQDWNFLGKQNLARWDNANDQIDTNWGDGRNVSAMAFELSDFNLAEGANWADVRSMSLTIGEETDKPRTDYAFISSNVNSIRFENQVESVPEPTTILASFLALGAGALFKKKNQQN